jgi:hypothetical protein
MPMALVVFRFQIHTISLVAEGKDSDIWDLQEKPIEPTLFVLMDPGLDTAAGQARNKDKAVVCRSELFNHARLQELLLRSSFDLRVRRRPDL